MLELVVAVIALVAGAGAMYAVNGRKNSSRVREADRLVTEARDQAERLTSDAARKAESTAKEAALAAKEESLRLQQASETEERQRKGELRALETRIMQREESLDRRNNALDQRERTLSSQAGQLDRRQAELEKIGKHQTDELQRIASLTQAEAHEELLQNVRKQAVSEEARILRESEQRARAQAEIKAREIVTTAIQRCASDQAGEVTVTTVHIPSDDVKGRIIGREGRNIRTFEQISGVSLVIDDTPETIVLSSFNPKRREKARVALENLVADGRIHPASIEETYKRADALVEQRAKEAGEQVAYDLGIHDLQPELVSTLGALQYRTSFGQNVLQHSKQVAEFAGTMAAELDLDPMPARRAGLLHDIGKAIDHDENGNHLGPHALLGADLCKRNGERPEIVHAVAAHHTDIDPSSVLDYLIMAADAISAARPGARRESAEMYVERLEKLERIAKSHDGVENTYAMQAGHEIHVMVQPGKVSDDEAVILAHDIAGEIESEATYPGQVRVVVIRESRATDVAK